MQNERSTEIFSPLLQQGEKLVILVWDATEVNVERSCNHRLGKSSFSTKHKSHAYHRWVISKSRFAMNELTIYLTSGHSMISLLIGDNHRKARLADFAPSYENLGRLTSIKFWYHNLNIKHWHRPWLCWKPSIISGDNTCIIRRKPGHIITPMGAFIFILALVTSCSKVGIMKPFSSFSDLSECWETGERREGVCRPV